jgi:hypothetical protein
MDLTSALSYFSPKHSLKLSFKRLVIYATKEFFKQPLFYVAFTIITLVLPLLFAAMMEKFGIGALPLFFIMLLLNPPLQLGTAAYLHHKHETHQQKFYFFFRPFRKEMLDLFIFSIITVSVLILLTFPARTMQQIMEDNGTMSVDGAAPLSLQIARLITLAAILFCSVCSIFAPYYIYFYKLKPIKAIRESYQTIRGAWFWFFALYLGIGVLMFGALMLGGLIAVVIGVLITLPISRIASYYVFAKYSNVDSELLKEDEAYQAEEIIVAQK